jgi:hypothetical protein
VTLSLIPYHNRTGRYRNFRTIKVIYMRGECSSQGFEQLEAKKHDYIGIIRVAPTRLNVLFHSH